jgi:hypothetical protein
MRCATLDRRLPFGGATRAQEGSLQFGQGDQAARASRTTRRRRPEPSKRPQTPIGRQGGCNTEASASVKRLTTRHGRRRAAPKLGLHPNNVRHKSAAATLLNPHQSYSIVCRRTAVADAAPPMIRRARQGGETTTEEASLRMEPWRGPVRGVAPRTNAKLGEAHVSWKDGCSRRARCCC